MIFFIFKCYAHLSFGLKTKNRWLETWNSVNQFGVAIKRVITEKTRAVANLEFQVYKRILFASHNLQWKAKYSMHVIYLDQLVIVKSKYWINECYGYMAICVILIHVEMTCNLRVMCNYHKFSSNIWAMATVLTTVVMTPWINSNFTINLHTIWSNAWVGSVYYVNERLQTLGNLFKEINFNHTVLNLNSWKEVILNFVVFFYRLVFETLFVMRFYFINGSILTKSFVFQCFKT